MTYDRVEGQLGGAPVVDAASGDLLDPASADALALTRLGLEDVAVYDGSLEEWAADPAVPLELGR